MNAPLELPQSEVQFDEEWDLPILIQPTPAEMELASAILYEMSRASIGDPYIDACVTGEKVSVIDGGFDMVRVARALMAGRTCQAGVEARP